VQIAELGVVTLADRLGVADDHRADQWVRAYGAAPRLRGQLQRTPEVDVLLGGCLCTHA
jgi:hypothetical protein